MPENCTRLRRMKITHGTLNMATGKSTQDREEWVTRPCGAPLFGDVKAGGVCRSCQNGWTCATNYPVDSLDDTREARDVIAKRERARFTLSVEPFNDNRPGELLTMGDATQWFHPHSGGAPVQITDANRAALTISA